MMEYINVTSYSDEDSEKIVIRPHVEFDIHVGKWVITKSLYIHVVVKPNWLHRSMARLLLGWEWEEKK
jgi:hypothetical protein